MKNLILTTAVLALTAGAALADGHGVVRMGTEGAYPPYNFLNDAGEWRKKTDARLSSI